MKDLREKTFKTGVVKIYFVEGPPSGSPLVLLHGGGDRWQHFLPLIPHLTKSWHVYALDLRGHGKSGRVSGQYRPEHYADDIVEFLDSAVKESVILFGHSLGGWVALIVAATRSEKIKALILGDPPLSMERFLTIEGSENRIAMWRTLRELGNSGLSISEFASGLAEMQVPIPGKDTTVRYGDLSGVSESSIREWADILSQVDPDVVQYHAEGRLNEYVQQVEIETILRQLQFPILLVQADPKCGGVVSDEDAKNALALMSNGVHVMLDDTGHDLGFSHGNIDLLKQAVTGFLESL
jgi:pimeloyl-ACP methyl ester carboxylesterase